MKNNKLLLTVPVLWEAKILITNPRHVRGKKLGIRPWWLWKVPFGMRFTCTQCGSHFSSLDSACHSPLTLWSLITSKHAMAIKIFLWKNTEDIIWHKVWIFFKYKQKKKNQISSVNQKVDGQKQSAKLFWISLWIVILEMFWNTTLAMQIWKTTCH